MLVKIFKHGSKSKGNTTANSVKNYLLNERKQQGTARIIRGNEPLTSQVINRSNFASTYTAGCLSFGEHEKSLTDEQKQALMQSFEDALLPDFDPSRYACYWVEHTDKNRLELNFVFAKTDLATGKHLDIYTDRRDRYRLNNWKEIQIQQYGLDDPNDPIREQEIKPIPHAKTRADGSILTDESADMKKAIHEYIRQKIETGDITCRQDVIDAINHITPKNQPNQPLFRVIKETKTSITVQHLTQQGMPMRLKGSFYARDFAINPSASPSPSIIKDDRQARHRAYVAQAQSRLATAKTAYHEQRQKRSDELQKRFDIPTPQPKPQPTRTPQPQWRKHNEHELTSAVFKRYRDIAEKADRELEQRKDEQRKAQRAVQKSQSQLEQSRNWIQRNYPTAKAGNQESQTREQDAHARQRAIKQDIEQNIERANELIRVVKATLRQIQQEKEREKQRQEQKRLREFSPSVPTPFG